MVPYLQESRLWIHVILRKYKGRREYHINSRLWQKIYKRKTVLKNTAEEEIAREKGVFEEGEFGDDSAKLMYLERERDFLRLHDKPGCRFLLACEVESGANYEMPVRCFTYDSIEYTDQLKEWKRKSQQMFWGRGKRGKNGA
ncbi:MAG: hypothetical protein ACLTER_27100 [Ruminococcus sp.]